MKQKYMCPPIDHQQPPPPPSQQQQQHPMYPNQPGTGGPVLHNNGGK